MKSRCFVTVEAFVLIGCSLWTRKPNTAAGNGAFYGWYSPSDCMTACLTSTNCVAFDGAPVGCVLHFNMDDLATSYHATGVTQFLLNRYCLHTKPPTTEGPRTTTTASTSMLSEVFAGSDLHC